jgi:hypothetical protein
MPSPEPDVSAPGDGRLEGPGRGEGQARSQASMEKPPSEPVADLIGPEPLKPYEGLIEAFEFVRAYATDLLDRHHMLVVEPANDIVNVAALLGQADANGAAVDARAGMMKIAGLDELLDVIDIRAEVIAARNSPAVSSVSPIL